MTLLRVCVLRALQLTDAGANGDRIGTWTTMTAAGRGAKCADFICSWARALDDLDADEISVETYGRSGYDSLRTAYRRLADFREMFQEEDPNRIARVVRDQARSRREAPSAQWAVAV